jgi:hypothetical protein
MQKNTVFGQYSSKNLSPPRLNLQLTSNFAKASTKQIETSEERFCEISIPYSKYEFFKVTGKKFRRKCASKVG